MGQLMVDIINTAEYFVTNFSDKMYLDFSIKSLDEIDDFLDEMCNYDLDEDSIYNIYTMVGSYVFEVARRQYGGRYCKSQYKFVGKRENKFVGFSPYSSAA